MSSWCRNLIVFMVCLSLSGVLAPASAVAGVIGADQYLAVEDRQVRIDRVQEALRQERISERLAAMGVDPELAQQRVASLPTADLVALDERLEDLPAGAGVLELIVIVFLVMLILDLTGLTNIFPGIGPGQVR